MTEEKNTAEKPKIEPKLTDYLFMDDQAEDLDFSQLESQGDLAPELKEFLEALGQDGELDKSLNEMIEGLDLSRNIDLEEIKKKIIILLRDQLGRIKSIDESNVKRILKKRDKAISKHLQELSQYLVLRQAQRADNKKGVLATLGDKFSKQARIDFKNIFKRFAIYEVYMVMNPKRIAGENKIINFVHNMIIGGFEKARKYEGGKDSDIASYSQAFIDKLAKRHIALTKAGRIKSLQKSRGWER